MARMLVAGNVNIETTVNVGGFPVAYQPSTFVFHGIGSRVSGVGYNLARALTTLGDAVTLVSVIGRDLAASMIRATLASDGLDGTFVVDPAEHTPQSVVLYDADGQRHIFTDLKDVLDQTYPAERFEAALDGCSVSLLTNIAYNRGLLPLAKARGVPIVTDVHGLTNLDDPYNRPFLEAATWLFMSGEGLGEPAEDWARRVLERYPAELVIVGLGAHGAVLATRHTGRCTRTPAVVTRPVVSTGGAGDALLAAFVHSYAETGNAEVALRLATVFASYKIGSAGSSEGFLDHQSLADLAAQGYGSIA